MLTAEQLDLIVSRNDRLMTVLDSYDPPDHPLTPDHVDHVIGDVNDLIVEIERLTAELAATKERLQGSREHVEEEHRKVVSYSRDIRELLDQRDEHRKKIARLTFDLEEAVELAKALEQERDQLRAAFGGLESTPDCDVPMSETSGQADPALRYPHARCSAPTLGPHIPHTWGDPVLWCDGEPRTGGPERRELCGAEGPGGVTCAAPARHALAHWAGGVRTTTWPNSASPVPAAGAGEAVATNAEL